ncbi:Phosphatase [Fasciola hepatica]|uniref:protein-serine/threonine phosphatase n=1 Tax=Fasciola hepatica TaxID=6192 RepID=A0A4E0RJ03_FASHE|nr:Phosphatase [Fasciola hepatica]
MGQTLNLPVVSKETNFWENEQYFVAASSMQGWRVHMEDAHTCLLELPGDPKAAYFSVFDGHGGTRVAKHAGLHLHERLVLQPEYITKDIKEAIRRAFLSLDSEMQAEMTSFSMPKKHDSEKDDSLSPRPGGIAHTLSGTRSERGNNLTLTRFANPGDELAGSTGIVVLLREHMLYCGNAGDSRAVCSRHGVAEPLSTDHKPTLPGERERITAAGGWVDANRVNGNLALSRAFGDFVFKRNPRQTAENQIVCANPDVYSRRLRPEEDEFIVLCCDGVWDVMTNQEVISFVRLRLSHGISPTRICEELMMRCLAPNCHTNGLGCDNMTVVLVCLLYGKPMSDLQRRCSRPCLAGPAADILSG